MRDSVRRLIAAVFACGLVAAAPAIAETRALLAGVWKYGSPLIPDLVGPENDLAAMESLIRAEGASDVTVLRNDGVTRTTFETALHALGLRARPGDWIFIYYSGHGAQAEAAVKGTADGDFDQFLPLANFDLDHQDSERFIVDKDLYAWVSRYVPRGVEVLMMADSCHSGTLHRSVDLRAWHFTPRLAFRGDSSGIKLVARPAPRFDAVLNSDASSGPEVGLQRAELPNEVYLAAALDDQLALEAPMPAEGAPSRGLLTYAFEQALTQYGPDGKTLAADADHDGKLSVGELAVYLNSQVRALTGQRQEPAAHYVSGADRLALFETLAKPAAPTGPPQPPLPAVWTSAPALRAQLATETILRAAVNAGTADFVWDADTGTVLRRSGDTVAEGVRDLPALRGVIEKWRSMAALTPSLSEARARLVIGPQRGDARYKLGETVAVSLDQPKDGPAMRYATIFDVGSDGTVRTLFPIAEDGAGALSAGTALPVLATAVVAPLGTDHVVALVTPAPPARLRALLRTIEGQRGVGRLVAPIEQELATDGAAASLSVGELYTGR